MSMTDAEAQAIVDAEKEKERRVYEAKRVVFAREEAAKRTALEEAREAAADRFSPASRLADMEEALAACKRVLALANELTEPWVPMYCAPQVTWYLQQDIEGIEWRIRQHKRIGEERARAEAEEEMA